MNTFANFELAETIYLMKLDDMITWQEFDAPCRDSRECDELDPRRRLVEDSRPNFHHRKRQERLDLPLHFNGCPDLDTCDLRHAA
jgi:hypothetical protein